MIWFDVETVGLNGPCMRVQWSIDAGPVHFWDFPHVNQMPLPLLDALYDHNQTLVAFNAAFDVYHLYRIMHTQLGLSLDSPNRPVRRIPCRVLDLAIPAMLHGPFAPWSFSRSKSRAVARVRGVPAVAVPTVQARVLSELAPHIPSTFGLSVGHHAVKNRPYLTTLSFSVTGSASLKAHMEYWGYPTLKLADLWPMVDRDQERMWLPYPNQAHEDLVPACTQIMNNPDSGFHRYCLLDILYLRAMYERLGHPAPDHHSDCVHAVAYTRYHGFRLDQDLLTWSAGFYASRVRDAEQALAGIDLKSAPQRLKLIQSVDPLIQSSRRAVLETLAETDRPSAHIARAMLNFGKYRQRLMQVQKAQESRTGRAHPSLRVMGAATGRMAGEAGINWQGIAQPESGLGIRAAMECEMGGDFDALEITIAASAYHDEQLQADLDQGVDLHSMTGSMLPDAIRDGWTYERIRDGRKDSCVAAGLRQTGKRCNFAVIYGAAAPKIAEVIGGTDHDGAELLNRFFQRYRGIGAYRANAEERVKTADTDKWDRGSVSRMLREIDDLTGYQRRWVFEAQVAEIMWDLGGRGIHTGMVGTVIRSAEKGPQPIDQAVRSALLGSAISIQAAVCRQVCNSPVQSAGANLTKLLMAAIWQRTGVPILNVHDELILGDGAAAQAASVHDETEQFLRAWRLRVPSLNISMKAIERWSQKG